MPVHNKSVYSVECSHLPFKFQPQKDLLVTGIITEKFFTIDKIDSEVIFYSLKMNIIALSSENVDYFYAPIGVGDEIDFSLNYSFNIVGYE